MTAPIMVREVRRCVKLGIPLVIFFGTFLVLPYIGKIILLGLLSFWTYKEFVTLITPELSFHHAVFWCFLSIPIQYYFVATGWYGMFLVFIPIYVFLFIPLQLVFPRAEKNMLTTISKLHWGLMAFVFGLSHLGYFYNVELEQFTEINRMVAWLVLLTLSTDSLHYLIDKILREGNGHHPSIKINVANISICTIVVSLASFWANKFIPYSPAEAWFVGGGIALVSLAGKNGMSEIRTDLGIDKTDLMPGTGALLTSFDSLCYTIPIFFHVTYYFYGI